MAGLTPKLTPKLTKVGLAEVVDLTLLRPDAARTDVERFLDGALKYPFASVCVPPVYVALAVERLKGTPTKVGTVSAFPLGYQSSLTKLIEAREARELGAAELDMVANISDIKSGDFDSVRNEVSAIVTAVPELTLKIIIDCCYLTDDEKVKATKAVKIAGAAFIKTSTGFGPGGATISDVRLLKEAAGGVLKVKAAGGIKTLGDALKMIEAGADRIGTSSAVEMVEELD